MSENKEVIYNLQRGFDYALKGETQTASFLTLLPPTMKTHTLAAALKQSVMKMFKHVALEQQNVPQIEVAEKDIGSKDTDSEGGELDSSTVLTVMFSNDHVDVNVIFEQAKSLFRQGAILVDGEIKLNQVLIEKMSIDDFQNLTGEYIANFTVA